MDGLNKRQIISIAITIVLIYLNMAFIILAIPVWLVIYLEIKLKEYKRKEKKEEKEIPIETDEVEIEQIRALSEKAEKERQKWIDYRRNVDVRQFKGRMDVTRQEVADYLWYHKQWEGRHEKCIILEEIMRVSNINENDCKWIIKEHYNHKCKNGENGAGNWIRNEEERRIIEYERKKIKEKEEKINKEINRIDESIMKSCPEIRKYIEKDINKIKKEKNEEHEYIYDYENWLEKKGYK